MTWGQVGGILNATKRKPIDLAFSYRHGKKTLTGSSQLEANSFIGTDASAKPAESMARSLDKIATALRTVASDVRQQQRATNPKTADELKAIAVASGIGIVGEPKKPGDQT